MGMFVQNYAKYKQSANNVNDISIVDDDATIYLLLLVCGHCASINYVVNYIYLYVSVYNLRCSLTMRYKNLKESK